MTRKKKNASDTAVEKRQELWERKKEIYRELEDLRVKIEEKEKYLDSL